MQKWQPGLPLKVQPTDDLTKLGDVVMKGTLALWEEEIDRYEYPFPFLCTPPLNDDKLVVIPSSLRCQLAHAANANLLLTSKPYYHTCSTTILHEHC